MNSLVHIYDGKSRGPKAGLCGLGSWTMAFSSEDIAPTCRKCIAESGEAPVPKQESTRYITVWCNEEGDIWAVSFNGDKSEVYPTAMVPTDQQDENVLKAVKECMDKVHANGL